MLSHFSFFQEWNENVLDVIAVVLGMLAVDLDERYFVLILQGMQSDLIAFVEVCVFHGYFFDRLLVGVLNFPKKLTYTWKDNFIFFKLDKHGSIKSLNPFLVLF